MAYAERTDVPVAQSINEIRKLVEKHGGGQWQFGEADDRLAVAFTADNRQVRFVAHMPPPPPTATERRAWEQMRRSRARAMKLVILAKFESVTSRIETFEEAFLAQLVMPDGNTVWQMSRQAIANAYTNGQQPPALLPDYTNR